MTIPRLTISQEPASINSRSPSFFSPYQSPLKKFHAYRFHPEYKQQIPGGLRSLTYTNKIDAKKELCRYELMGGTCNDDTCEFQHFREMGLPGASVVPAIIIWAHPWVSLSSPWLTFLLTDDVLLQKLGSPDEFGGEQRNKFIEGLKAVLSGLRARKINDFDTLASEIVAHRAKFLGDSSKVLSLEGTTI